MQESIFKIVAFFQKCPSNKNIRIIRGVFGGSIVVIFGVLGGNFVLDLPIFLMTYELWIKYAIAVLGLFPLFFACSYVCIFKKKHMQWIQFLIALSCIFMGGWMMQDVGISSQKEIESEESVQVPQEEEDVLAYEDHIATLSSEEVIQIATPWNPRVVVLFLALIPMFGAITGKLIPSYCIKYREKITKIRV